MKRLMMALAVIVASLLATTLAASPASASPGNNERFIAADHGGVSIFLREIKWKPGQQYRRGTARLALTGVGYWFETTHRFNKGPIALRATGWGNSCRGCGKQPNRIVLSGRWRYIGYHRWVFHDRNRDNRWDSPLPLDFM